MTSSPERSSDCGEERSLPKILFCFLAGNRRTAATLVPTLTTNSSQNHSQNGPSLELPTVTRWRQTSCTTPYVVEGEPGNAKLGARRR